MALGSIVCKGNASAPCIILQYFTYYKYIFLLILISLFTCPTDMIQQRIFVNIYSQCLSCNIWSKWNLLFWNPVTKLQQQSVCRVSHSKGLSLYTVSLISSLSEKFSLGLLERLSHEGVQTLNVVLWWYWSNIKLYTVCSVHFVLPWWLWCWGLSREQTIYCCDRTWVPPIGKKRKELNHWYHDTRGNSDQQQDPVGWINIASVV